MCVYVNACSDSRLSVWHHAPAVLAAKMEPQYIGKKMGGPQGQSKYSGGEGEYLSIPDGNRTQSYCTNSHY